MTIARIFLDDRSPALSAGVAYLIDRYRNNDSVDLQNVIVVVPGARAGRRLRELLVSKAEDSSLEFWPPDIVTVGRLPELLYEPKLKLASTLLQNVAWADALQKMDLDIVRQVIPNAPGRKDDHAWRDVTWLDYGTLLCSQYRTLAAESLTFSDVAERTARMQIGNESRRWGALATIQQQYLNELDAAQLWDRQTARVVAVRQKEIITKSDIVLLATVDISRVHRDMLSQISDRVTSLVYAPEIWHDRFDEFGCLVPDAWHNQPLQVPDSMIVHVEGPEEQAVAVSQILHSYAKKYAADEITIGVPDSDLVPFIQRELSNSDPLTSDPLTNGPSTHWAGGQSVRQSEPYLLLDAVAEYLDTASARSVAALVRHPRMAERVPGHTDQGNDWLVELDRAYEKHLPTRLFRDSADSTTSKTLQQFSRLLPRLCGGLNQSEKRLPRWASAIEEFLLSAYGTMYFDRDIPEQAIAHQSAVAIQHSLTEMGDLPHDFAPTVTAAEAIRYVLNDVESQSTVAHTDPNALELLGWLELPLDDAPALVVTSFHERFIPQSINSDLFLPNTLRQELGIDDNRRRYARDAYALSVLIRSREQVHLIVARRNMDGDPELPSRLLFAEENETITKRCVRFFSERSDLDPIFTQAADAIAESVSDPIQIDRPSRFAPPHPNTLKYNPVEKLSPTAFRSYIACKYRFFLRHVMQIESVSEDLSQMDPRGFGNLMHLVLESLGTNRALRDCSDEEQIESFLSDELDKQVAKTYGLSPPPAVRIQVEGLRLRLRAFSVCQARRVADGWRTIFAEEEVEFVFPGTDMRISGKMDRIDVHRETDDWAVFDYKSSEAGKTPEATHRRKQMQWIDLQLPLYHHLARTLAAQPDSPKFSGRLHLGFVVLPSDLKSVSFQEASWSEADLASADDRIREIIGQILSNDFWPPTDPPPDFSEWAAAICLDNVLDRNFS